MHARPVSSFSPKGSAATSDGWLLLCGPSHPARFLRLQAAAAAPPPGPPPRPLMSYEVVIATGTKLGAGTDALVRACMGTSTSPAACRPALL